MRCGLVLAITPGVGGCLKVLKRYVHFLPILSGFSNLVILYTVYQRIKEEYLKTILG